MDEQLVGTLTHGAFKADVYSTERPGEFRIRYHGRDGQAIEDVPLTGVSSYKQREDDIIAHLRDLEQLGTNAPKANLADAGEY